MVFDDHYNITENRKVAIHDLSFSSLKSALFSNDSGPLKRLLPALSFGINHFIAGGFKKTFIFKATNLVIHLINTGLAFWLAFLLCQRLSVLDKSISRKNTIILAVFTALAWSLHPIQITAVTYVVQRMTSMSACFVLLGLCLFVIGRERLEQKMTRGLFWMYTGVFGGVFFSLLCKENGVLLPLYAGVIEFTLYADSRKILDNKSDKKTLQRDLSLSLQALKKPPLLTYIKHNLCHRFTTFRSRLTALDKQSRQLLGFYLVTLFLPAISALFFGFVYPGHLLDGFNSRPFTFSQRLLTEARVLWLYIYMLFVPDIHLMGLFHDDFPLSKGILTPISTLFSILDWGITVILAILARKRTPLISFAILWFLSGQSLESSFIPLMLVFEHRNYLPSFGFALLCIYGIFYICGLFFSKLKILPTLLCTGLITGLFYATFSRNVYWGTEEGLITTLARHHPFSAKSQYLYGEMLNKKYNNVSKGFNYFYKSAQLEPNEVGILIKLALVTPMDVLSNPIYGQQITLYDPRRIGNLLEKGPVSAWGLKAMYIVSRCVLAKHRSCRNHHRLVINWMKALLLNSQLTLSQKRYFTVRLFDAEMEYKLYDDAMATVIEANSKDMRFFDYYLMYAYVLAVTGQYSQSLNVLAQVDYQFTRSNPKFKSKVNNLRLNIRKIRNVALTSKTSGNGSVNSERMMK